MKYRLKHLTSRYSSSLRSSCDAKYSVIINYHFLRMKVIEGQIGRAEGTITIANQNVTSGYVRSVHFTEEMKTELELNYWGCLLLGLNF